MFEEHFIDIYEYLFIYLFVCLFVYLLVLFGCLLSEETEGATVTGRDWRKSTTKTPIFVSSVPVNVTIQYGAHAHLVCRVQDAGNKSVWNVNFIFALWLLLWFHVIDLNEVVWEIRGGEEGRRGLFPH